jgi:flagellar basal-body rod protein FlgB
MGEGAIGRVRADVYDNPEINYSNDGNTVDLEKEMSKQVQNSIMYNAATQLINKKLAALKYAASEGGR